MILHPPLDLNLLRLLVEVHDAGSVSIAGRRLGLSQPAASNALARLRTSLSDPLFVRSKDGMVPTAYAQKVVPVVREHLSGIATALAEALAFDPSTSTRTFRLSLSGLGEQTFLPPLARRVAELAPKITIENISAPRMELPTALARQDADIAIGILNYREQEIHALHLFDERYHAVGNPDLADADLARLSLKDMRIILVTPSATYAEDLEVLLERHGLSSSICYRLRHFGGLPEMLQLTDAVAIVPGELMRRLELSGAARRLPIDLPLGRHGVRLIWHSKSDNDPGCIWLRGLVRDLFGTSSPGTNP